MKEKKRKLKQAMLLTILNFLVIILLSSIVTQLSSWKNCRFGRHCQFLTTLNTLLLYYPTIVLLKITHMIENLHLHQKKKNVPINVYHSFIHNWSNLEANQKAFNRWLERNPNCDARTQMACHSEIKINDPSSHERLGGNVNASGEGTDLKSLCTAWFQLSDILKTKQTKK